MKIPTVRFSSDPNRPVAILIIEAPRRPHVTRAITRVLSLANVRVLSIDEQPARHLLIQRVRLVDHDGAPLSEQRRSAVRAAVVRAILRELPVGRERRPTRRWSVEDTKADWTHDDV